MAMTLYLKYRPQTVEELDEASVREAMAKILTGKSLPHAWLFSGPRGTGKTSSARILGKAINCTNKNKNAGFEPCNECGICNEITAGNAPDVVEIDAASNRGIEEIRDLREKVRLAPMRAKFKVYIIDEVHMLTTEAANALLKTLEEPPESTVFVLCTTDPEKLPETVISRCTRIVFKKPTLYESIRSLERVVSGENAKADKQALEMIAQEARGSFRDGTKLLEQVLLSNKEVTETAVREVTGQLASADPEKFVELWGEGRQREALEFIDQLVEHGINLRSWVERLVEAIRIPLLATQDAVIRKSYIEKIYKLNKVYEQMKTAAVVQLPLEIMVLEDSNNNQTIKSSSIPALPQKINPIKANVTPINSNPPKSEIKQIVEEQSGLENKKEAGKGKYSLEDITQKWPDILKAVKPKNHSVEGLLRSTKAVNFDGDKLTLEVFYKFHKDKLESDKCRSIIETAVGEVFGIAPVKLFFQLGQKAPKKDNLSGDVGEDIIAAAAEIFKADVV